MTWTWSASPLRPGHLPEPFIDLPGTTGSGAVARNPSGLWARVPLPPHTLIMVIDADLADLIELLQFPHATGAPGGVLLGLLGGLLGSFAILRQLSFFSHTVGHAALLGLFWGGTTQPRPYADSVAIYSTSWCGLSNCPDRLGSDTYSTLCSLLPGVGGDCLELYPKLPG